MATEAFILPMTSRPPPQPPRPTPQPRTPRMQTYDLIVIGSGPGGQRAAIQGAKAGKRVAVIEKQTSVGGVCINLGTIPSKTMREAVLHLSGFYEHGFYGSSNHAKEDVPM